MKALEKLREGFRYDLHNAREKRAQAVMTMNVADAEIEAFTNALERVEKEIAAEEKRKKEGVK